MPDIEQIKQKLPPELREVLDKNPQEAQRILQSQMKVREERFPSKNFVPNIGQERALKCFLQKHPEYNDFPKTTIMLGGNGVGKTALASNFIAGVTLGKEFLNQKYFNYDYFDECAEIRKKRAFRMRIVCDAADVEESGSVYEQITEWLPVAKFENKVGYYHKIRIPPPTHGYHTTVIDIKTHKQEKVSHAGSNLDLIIFNEPPPKHIFNENKARIRDGGRMVLFLTPLDLAGYLCDVIDKDRPAGELYYTECPIWDNCRDIPGTRGHLRRVEIEDQIRDWESTDPTEVPARELGKFQHLAGSIFKIFSENVHCIDPMPINPNWNIFQIVDPHRAKPPFSVWLALTPGGDYYVIAEYPTEDWDKIITTVLSIRDFGMEFRKIESGKHENFQYITKLNVKDRLGDPLMFKDKQPHNNQTLQMQYDLDCGLWYETEGVINDITMRIDRIKNLLRYNYRRPVDSVNRPRLYIFNTCTNMIRALKYFSIKKSAQGEYHHGDFDKTWECPIAALGYGVTSIEQWSPYKPKSEEHDDYWEITQSRIPSVARMLNQEEEDYEYEFEEDGF